MYSKSHHIDYSVEKWHDLIQNVNSSLLKQNIAHWYKLGYTCKDVVYKSSVENMLYVYKYVCVCVYMHVSKFMYVCVFQYQKSEIRKGFNRHESLHRQIIYFGRKVHTLNIYILNKWCKFKHV